MRFDMISRRTILAGIGLTTIAPNITNARNSEFTFVVPSPPGGSADTSGRMLARSITTNTNTPITVSNRPAGQGVEGTMHVLNTPSDSGNVLIGGPNGLFFSPAREALSYNVDSFEPVCMFSMASFVLAARADRFRNIDELFNAMRERPINFAFSASDGRYLIERLSKAVNGKDIVAVSYRGGGEAVRDLHAGVVDVAITSLAAVAGGVQGGVIQLLAHSTDSGNVPAYPNLPHLRDVLQSEDPALNTFHWHGLYLQKNSPQSSIRFLQDSTKSICESQSFITEHVTRGMVSRYMDSVQLREHHSKMAPYMTGYINWLRETSTR
jgi:tripartite-type tricarboxylate transporter receptor subunit TctC